MSRSILMAPWLVLVLLIGATERDLARLEANTAETLAATEAPPATAQLPFLASGGISLDAAARLSGSAPSARTVSQNNAPWSGSERIALPQALASAQRYLLYARTLLDSRSGLPLTYGNPPPSTESC